MCTSVIGRDCEREREREKKNIYKYLRLLKSPMHVYRDNREVERSNYHFLCLSSAINELSEVKYFKWKYSLAFSSKPNFSKVHPSFLGAMWRLQIIVSVHSSDMTVSLLSTHVAPASEQHFYTNLSNKWFSEFVACRLGSRRHRDAAGICKHNSCECLQKKRPHICRTFVYSWKQVLRGAMGA